MSDGTGADEARAGSRGAGTEGGVSRAALLRRRIRALRRLGRRPAVPEAGRPEVAGAADVFEYPRKRRLVAYGLWLVGGFMGLHRFYLRRFGTAVAMTVTAGGLGLWWLVDALLIPGIVRDHNRAQERREEAGHPPVSLSFLPEDVEPSDLARRPDWLGDAGEGRWATVGDLAVVGIAGLALGTVSAGTGSYRASLAVLGLAAVLVAGRRLEPAAGVPLVGDFLVWSYRLRLFYHHVGPGGFLARLARPLTAAVLAPFRARNRGEVALYLQFGAAAVVLFTTVDVGRDVVAPLVAGQSLAGVPEAWLESVVLTFVNVYAFAVPIGATVCRQMLARRSRRSVVAVVATAIGALAVGALAVGAGAAG